jgi:hypothetical protein
MNEARDATPARPRAPAAAGAAAFDPLVPPLLALQAEADRVLRLRLQALQRRVNGPWASTPLPAGAAETLRSADGRELGRLWLEGASLVWQGSDGEAWRAPLVPDPPPR